ncbi:hypothetical protein [Natronorubrum texcoconense]|uniref:DUF7964 domain-containing protein n=1 Tax=Natronorubrum texcoconense TaxID=1095776 RepID=A0A1G9H8Z8_9EURY|nr:hypothetical protein [Natronorubrum texcoconense]SDL09372.1 hypothetical protein SAMN04515672_0151 [Natronorubrum texcoconense]
MSKTVSKLPDSPLDLEEVIRMDETYEYCLFSDANEVVAILILGNEKAHALGYDEEAGGWVVVQSEPIESQAEGHERIEDAIDDWAVSNYGDELASGELEMVTPGQRKKNHRPKAVEEGFELEYDCPECDFYKTGLTAAPQEFLNHLRNEHDYSSEEAHDVL